MSQQQPQEQSQDEIQYTVTGFITVWAKDPEDAIVQARRMSLGIGHWNQVRCFTCDDLVHDGSVCEKGHHSGRT